MIERRSTTPPTIATPSGAIPLATWSSSTRSPPSRSAGSLRPPRCRQAHPPRWRDAPPVEGARGAGLGKSTLLCELARVTRGQPIHDSPRRDCSLVIPGDVPILGAVILRSGAALLIVGRSADGPSPQLPQRQQRSGRLPRPRRPESPRRAHRRRHRRRPPPQQAGQRHSPRGAACCGLLLAQLPDDPERRALAASKSNLGRLPASLVSRPRAVPRLGVTRDVWEGSSLLTADLL